MDITLAELLTALIALGGLGLGVRSYNRDKKRDDETANAETERHEFERRVLVGGSRQVIDLDPMAVPFIRTASKDASAGYWARLPPSTYVDSIIPLYSLKGKGWLTPRQWHSRRPIKLQ